MGETFIVLGETILVLGETICAKLVMGETRYNQHHHMHPSFAAVLIVPPDKSVVLCFYQTSICLFESHTHVRKSPRIFLG